MKCFRLRCYVNNSFLVFHQGTKHSKTIKHSRFALVFHSVFSCLDPLMKHSNSLFTYNVKCVTYNMNIFCCLKCDWTFLYLEVISKNSLLYLEIILNIAINIICIIFCLTLNFPIVQRPSHLKQLNSWSRRGIQIDTRDVRKLHHVIGRNAMNI
jgi:hypothetical protein